MRGARAWLLVVATAMVGGCGGGDGGGGGVGPTPVFTSVSLTPAAPTVIVGLTEQVTATAKDQNGANMSGATFTYQSSDQTRATVNASGVVAGVAVGTARITVTGTIGSLSKTASVDVAVIEPGPTATVAATAGSVFDPRTVAITSGGSVTWTFALLHNVTFTAATGVPANIPDTGTGSVQRQFNTPGTFNYSCTIHPGMSGTVVVR
jgi:plastocyanin